MVDKAHEKLFEAVVSCELPPGAWLTASEISDFLGVGRTPTMQALLRLEMAGLVRPTKRKGWQITPLTLQNVNDTFETFRWLAPALAIMAARKATDKQINTFRKLNTVENPTKSKRIVMRSNQGAIRYLADICGNPIMAEAARGLAAHFDRIFNFATHQAGAAGIQFLDEEFYLANEATMDAIADRDEKRIQDTSINLIDVTEGRLKRILHATSSVLSAPIGGDRAS